MCLDEPVRDDPLPKARDQRPGTDQAQSRPFVGPCVKPESIQVMDTADAQWKPRMNKQLRLACALETLHLRRSYLKSMSSKGSDIDCCSNRIHSDLYVKQCCKSCSFDDRPISSGSTKEELPAS